MIKKENNIFEKINRFLLKKGHEIVMSVFLDGYNGNHIYIRVDYVPKIGVYKVVWFDLNFIDEKHLDRYVNMQMMTKFMAERLVSIMLHSKYESGRFEKQGIIGDRVEVLSYVKQDRYEFVYDRFLPKEWEFLIDPLVIIFSYLPKGMECMLDESFASFDGLEEKYNLSKPFEFDLMNGVLSTIYKKSVIEHAEVLVEDEMISFLECINDKYIAIVEGKKPTAVSISVIDDKYIRLRCSCASDKACYHTAAVILAIRKKLKLNSFYKVKLIKNDEDETLLDKITNSSYFLCFGITEDRLLIVSELGVIFEEPICNKEGKVQFEVYEDDDEMSLSKVLEGYKK